MHDQRIAEDRLDDIEVRLLSPMVTYKENATEDAPTLVAALRAVLALIEETRLPAPDRSILGGRVSAPRLYAAIANRLNREESSSS